MTVDRTPRRRVSLRAFASSRSTSLRVFVASWCILSVIGCAATQTATPTTNANTVDRLGHMHRVPLQRTGNGSALVKGKVNGHEIVLLLDTGAQSTVMDIGVANRIGIPIAPGKFQTVGVGPGLINARQGEVITLDLAGFPAQVRPTLQDFSGMMFSSMQRGRTPTIGLLGYDVLVSYGAIIDLDEGAMYLRKR